MQVLAEVGAVGERPEHCVRIGRVDVVGQRDEAIEVRANFAAYETQPDTLTRVFSVGQYRDLIAGTGGDMKFREKICVFDSELVPNSLIYPL